MQDRLPVTCELFILTKDVCLESSSGTPMITVSSIIREVSVWGNFFFYSLGKIVLFVLEVSAALPLGSKNVAAVSEVFIYLQTATQILIVYCYF